MPRSEPDNIVMYINQAHDRLEASREAVVNNLQAAQIQQKKWYDQQARDVTLKPGEKVLILIRTSHSKLLSHWQGPCKVGRVNYEVAIPGFRKEKWILHINMLKRWHDPKELNPDEVICYSGTVESDGEEDQLLDWKEQTDLAEVQLGEHLTAALKRTSYWTGKNRLTLQKSS